MKRALVHVATLAVALLASGLTGCSKHATSTTTPAGPGAQHTTNAPPDTWFSGPDPNDATAGWLVDPGPFGGRYIEVVPPGWGYGFPGVPNSMLSVDSLNLLPAARPEHRTFIEIYGDRIWLRQEGDTVHMNSWVVFPSGGSDPDSPYSVMVNQSLLPPWLGSPVLTPGDANGSPIGFRLRVQMQDVLGRVSQPSESTTYPVWDPTSVFHNPIVNGYQPLVEAGRAYAVARAVDGDGAVDRRIDRRPGEAVGIVDRVDAGGGSPEDIALRSKILTFYVDHPPQLLQQNPSFRPVAEQVFTRRNFQINLLAVDDDPFDALAQPAGHAKVYSHVGGPKGAPILRRRIAILGKWAGDPSRDTCYVVPGDIMRPMASFTIPDWIANGPITLLVRLCDCYSCDVRPGPGACPEFAGYELRPTFGTCVDTAIPCRLEVPAPVAGALGGVH